MSAKIPVSGRRDLKESAAKYHKCMDKENMYTVVQNGKSSEGRNDGGKKKGLSLYAENRVVRITPVKSKAKSPIGKAKFLIYFDDNEESVRSRPRVRKNVCRKEIRARRDNKVLERPVVSMTKGAEVNGPYARVFSRRARSSSNYRSKVDLDKGIEMNSKLFHYRRAYSESREVLSQNGHCIVQSSDGQKIKCLTDDVKKRTLSSIQMWKDKMRKTHTGTVPKNIAANVLDIDKKHAKTKLRKSPVIGSMDLQSEVSQNRATNPSENIKKQVPKVDSLTDVLGFLPNEIAGTLKNKPCLKTQADTNMRNFISENIQNNILSTTTVPVRLSSTVTPLDGPSSLLLTPTKVRYEKSMTRTPINYENELDIICEMTMYVCDYLKDVPETERKKEDNAPRLSSRFLRESVNPEQRRLIVGYIIRLGVHCHYSSHVIYQTIKLFNVAIDRILVEMNNIQLIALACLWITLKREAPVNKIPSATDILQFAKGLYTNQEKYLLMYERKILSAIKFNTRFADPFSLLSYYILNINQDCQCNIVRPNDITRIYFCGSYMIDLSMLDESLCGIPTYVIAIAAVELSLRFVYLSDVNVEQTWCQVWRSKQSLTEWEERVMNSTKRLMMQYAVENDTFASNIIYKKYMRSKHGKVSNFLHGKLNTITI